MINILVTGGAGFIGSNFIRHVFSVKEDWAIVNLDACTYAGNPANLEGISSKAKEKYHFIHGDITDGPLLERLFSAVFYLNKGFFEQ